MALSARLAKRYDMQPSELILTEFLKNVICGSLASLSLGAVSSDLDREDFGAPARQSELLSWVRSWWNGGWWCGVMCEEQVVEGGGQVVA